ncbi:helix-turn-helix domain-containing protein [Clostridioides sp. GD02377]|uniref:helix-turn-helix domain-containing protein n=1 Tax=Clostridioides TaxID=1870884 RepID=UPI000D1DD08F|nr:helix-turn-helix transcriptional regulator [Clostridioides difficile]MCI9975630.1 helix-turn-helix transcriptional regulator [Clostridioides difficile]MDI7817627.1 helix-turn-helix transcriptional regulator [Clostridioides difficile]MDO0133230.1 helix-turn-helix domain-containing protein [Clostridioides difficile]
MLRKLRKHKGMTQLELAEKLGWNRSQISKLENGKYKDITISTIVDLSIALEEDFLYLCDIYGKKEMEKRNKKNLC